jgi:hypothetical protein
LLIWIVRRPSPPITSSKPSSTERSISRYFETPLSQPGKEEGLSGRAPETQARKRAMIDATNVIRAEMMNVVLIT